MPASSLTPDAIRQIIKEGPGPKTALLGARASARKIAEAMAALANAHGGLVILGATKARKVPGVGDPDVARELMASAALLPSPPLILPLPQLIELDGKTVCVSQVPAGLPHVYSVRGQYLVRSGRETRPLMPHELRILLLNRGEASFEAQTPHGATLEALDPDRVRAYIHLLKRPPDEDPNDLLLSRGCLAETDKGLRPTMAGLLLFGKHPQRWLRSAEITGVRYAGPAMSDDFIREDIQGALPDQIRQAEAFVNANMRRGMRIRGFEREEVPEYPISVVREAIVNAVAHRDYSIRGDNIRILMFSDRMEVYSPGRLPGHVTLDNIVEERYSRNEAIVQVLSEMGFIERLGYGIDRMIRVCEEEGLPPPEFTETSAGFKVTIHSGAEALVGAGPPANLYAHLQLNPRQEKALAFLQKNRRITNREYQTLCPDASPETLRRDLADLVDKGLILKIGQKRATFYILK
ncbi:MAG TPA: transcriptional regulator [Caldilineae bacterium]|nr:transcriptional regulator [Caldilineae bacterium]HIQ11414.1 transcriptional regulator [Caldilineales bacterium]